MPVESPSCTASDCHVDLMQNAFLHDPVKEGNCDMCHGELSGHNQNPGVFKFQEIDDIGELCYSCHDSFANRPFMHGPAESGECTACHSPHGSPNKYQLMDLGSDLCFNCHDQDIMSGEFAHGPADAGGCLACHNPHSSDYAKNLRDEPPELCFSCHNNKKKELEEAKIIHKPAADTCVNCHNPHSNTNEYMLSNKVPDLCFGCHKKKKESVQRAATKHGALVVGKSCLNCHDAHASNIANRLSKAPLDLCLGCHNTSVKTDAGIMLTNMKELLEKNSSHHGPIKRKDCSGCHNPHGSDEFRMLKESYPSTFYMSYQEGNYTLCFKCHLKSIVQDPSTFELTNFRNGYINLHFRHVNRPEKGRTCRACHETHASNFPKHIRERVPFGNWEFPLNYIKTDTGGSCTPGCHKVKKYDREKEVINK
ncbi:MAG: hypothetical protein JSW20_00160 [Nitrospiraceae bacterium]|nr:MAG: hypothetical protein JSW20_00160 [Nitrospiraceae bacterium]